MTLSCMRILSLVRKRSVVLVKRLVESEVLPRPSQSGCPVDDLCAFTSATTSQPCPHCAFADLTFALTHYQDTRKHGYHNALITVLYEHLLVPRVTIANGARLVVLRQPTDAAALGRLRLW